jgi:molybdopterin molybdotransferase
MFRRFLGAREAKEMLLDRCLPILQTMQKASTEASGEVISRDIISPESLPGFDRAAMDGFAVRSAGTRGARPSSPVLLEDFQPMRTGMEVPEEYDAVVMLEDARLRNEALEISAEVHAYKNVSLIGEDIRQGDVVFLEGHALRPPDVALLSALGIDQVSVYARPRIVIIPTGGELVAIGTRTLRTGEAYEINSHMASLYVEKWGGKAQKREIVTDDPKRIRETIASNLDADMIIIIGGTSVGEKDYAPSVLDEMGELFVHGVRLQPGKPTAFGVVSGIPIVCLPGYPVAALSDLYLFVRPALQKMAHRNDAEPKISVKLARKIPSRPGYLSMVRVALKNGEAEPIMISGAGILSSVARADGFVIVPEELEGREAGEVVEVFLFE